MGSTIRVAGAVLALAFSAAGGCSKTRVPSCPGTCPRPNPTRLELLAGQPGGPGWVDGPLASAHFNEPWAVAGDGKGHIYVADLHVIRDIDTAAGTVRTLAGSHGRAGGRDGVGSEALFNTPCGLLYTDGALYVADTENHAIRRIDVGTAAVTTVAGTIGAPGSADAIGGLARFREPEGLALDADGNLYVGDTDNNEIRVLSLRTGAVRTLAGVPDAAGTSDGVGPAARFDKPKGLAIGASGTLYVIDSIHLSVRAVDTKTGAVSTVSTFRSLPQGIAAFGGDLLVALAENRIVRLSAGGAVEPWAGAGSPRGAFVDGPMAGAGFSSPAGLWRDPSGTVYAADLGNAVVRAISPEGVVRTYAGARSAGSDDGPGAAARFASPQAMVADGSAVYVADGANDTVRKIAWPSGEVTTLAGEPGQAKLADGALREARFHQPSGLALDGPRGLLYVADTQNRAVRRIDLRAGTVSTLSFARAPGDAFIGFEAPTGLALEGNVLFVSDYAEHVVVAVDLKKETASTLAGTYGVPGRSDGAGKKAAFYGPMGIASDGAGHLFVADDMNETVREIDLAGATVSTLAGRPVTPGSTDGARDAARFHFPMGIAADGHGDVFVADSFNHLVRRIDASTGAVTTLIGATDAAGVRLGPLPAQLAKPSAVALTPTGEVLVSSENAILVAR